MNLDFWKNILEKYGIQVEDVVAVSTLSDLFRILVSCTQLLPDWPTTLHVLITKTTLSFRSQEVLELRMSAGMRSAVT